MKYNIYYNTKELRSWKNIDSSQWIGIRWINIDFVPYSFQKNHEYNEDKIVGLHLFLFVPCHIDVNTKNKENKKYGYNCAKKSTTDNRGDIKIDCHHIKENKQENKNNTT